MSKFETKISVLRQFGSENMSVTVQANSDTLISEKELQDEIDKINFAIEKQFHAVSDREMSEKKYLTAKSNERMAAIDAQTKAIKDEMNAAQEADRIVTKYEKTHKGSK